ncbi:MAG: phosphoenolpyruvate--protein phosphotransferase [Agathobacter sp.]|nr:phosphoenolpyruvate--protein phosphotransferase [Agathobacter sp.]
MEGNKLILTGNPVSPGIAMAKAYVYYPLELAVEEGYFQAEEKQENLKAFHEALSKTKEELKCLYEMLATEDEEKAKIFLAHIELLEDEELLDEIQLAIEDECMNPDYAIEKVFDEFTVLLSKVADPLIAGRAADLQDVKRRLLRVYQGKEEKNLSTLTEDVIVVAHDLLPSDTATLNRQHVKGIVTEIGGSNSHSAILARSFQIPAVLGVADAMKQIPDGEFLSIDALSGILVVNPDKDEQQAFLEKRRVFLEKRKIEEQYLDKAGATKDGYSIQIGINVGSTDFDVPKTQFDFVGLFRTEFLYMENTHLPTEEEQFEAYKKVLEHAKGNPVTLRTLDIGGDKTLPYMELPEEENPFLGKRALRLCFAEPDIFMTQLRAALRASAYGPLQIMFPMVGSMEDIYRAKAYVREAMEQLQQEKAAFDKDIKIGIMIEVPSIALIADMAAEEVDFASVGSNDLTQYVSATDRMNSEVTSYYQNYSPAMIRLLGYIADAFNQKGKELSVCGEMAGNPKAAVILAGLGIKKLSMSATNIAGVKAALANITLEDARELANKCKKIKTEEEIINLF